MSKINKKTLIYSTVLIVAVLFAGIACGCAAVAHSVPSRDVTYIDKAVEEQIGFRPSRYGIITKDLFLDENNIEDPAAFEMRIRDGLSKETLEKAIASTLYAEDINSVAIPLSQESEIKQDLDNMEITKIYHLSTSANPDENGHSSETVEIFMIFAKDADETEYLFYINQ